MKRPCLDCGMPIERGSRCRRCKAERRGTSADQAAYRRRVLAATAGACVRCGAIEKVEAHHVVALGDGGDKHGPGVPLCGACHRLAHGSS
jgi:hypothetical protein